MRVQLPSGPPFHKGNNMILNIILGGVLLVACILASLVIAMILGTNRRAEEWEEAQRKLRE